MAALPAAAQQPGQPLSRFVQQQHAENIRRLQSWIRQPSIAAEDRGMQEGCELMMNLLRAAGFGTVERINTKGQPGVLGVLDAGAARTVGLYFMYDVKQADASEWKSPPWEAALVDWPLGQVLIGRGAVNQKGPQSAVLAALHAFQAAGGKPPVNLVVIAEGEEEIGSPNFLEMVTGGRAAEALRRCSGVYMPMAIQDMAGLVEIDLGAKGVVELELVSSGERWGRGPKADIHSSMEAAVDSPAWHLVKALSTLVGKDGHTPAIEGFADKARPISAAEKVMIRELTRRTREEELKRAVGISRWVHDVGYLEAMERLYSRPTVNIEGLVGGYTGPGGKTILPHRAVAKLDLRLVPDMTAAGAVAAVKAHLAKHGFSDIEVKMTGGYDPTSTAADSALIRAQLTLLKRAGIDPMIGPRMASSWPGYVFTGAPLRLPAGFWGMGYGNGAHAPDEHYLIVSKNPKLSGYDGAVQSHIDYWYELAATA